MDINSPEFADFLIDLIDTRQEINFPKLQIKYLNWKTCKVAASGSGATVSVYVGNSTTAVNIKNPNSFSLTAGQLVAVISPNNKNDDARYIDRILRED